MLHLLCAIIIIRMCVCVCGGMYKMYTKLFQMQSPDFQAMLTNPRALQAIMQIQQGMQQLQQEAPGLVTGYMISQASLEQSFTYWCSL